MEKGKGLEFTNFDEKMTPIPLINYVIKNNIGQAESYSGLRMA